MRDSERERERKRAVVIEQAMWIVVTKNDSNCMLLILFIHINELFFVLGTR